MLMVDSVAVGLHDEMAQIKLLHHDPPRLNTGATLAAGGSGIYYFSGFGGASLHTMYLLIPLRARFAPYSN